jgi:dolichyl-phosphate beta-glucosyltransferase
LSPNPSQLFTRDAASLLFADMHLERWSFDVELLVLASACTVQSTPSSLVRHPVCAKVLFLANAHLLCSGRSRTAQRSKSLPIPISETPIDWTEIAGSKISLVWDSLGMARDLLVLRLCLGLTKWGVPRIVLDRSEEK